MRLVQKLIQVSLEQQIRGLGFSDLETSRAAGQPCCYGIARGCSPSYSALRPTSALGAIVGAPVAQNVLSAVGLDMSRWQTELTHAFDRAWYCRGQ